MVRKYRLNKRAKSQEKTRQRIVEATVKLHTTVGPAHTSLVAIANRAGVERPTVYRHFPTMKELFSACSSHHWLKNPPPDPEPWLKIDDPAARLRQGLGELYAYYSIHQRGMWKILRDLEDMPELRPFAAHRLEHRQRVHEVLADAWPNRGSRQKTRMAAIGHGIDFFAWRSLRRQGLNNGEAIELMVHLILSI